MVIAVPLLNLSWPSLQFISTVNKGKKGALDSIGRGGGLAAAGGGGSYEDYAGGGSGRRVDYERGRA